ncbi:hypothetical protein IF1G_06856 [Cordyceps javanica]|uniref:Uncharacterized protein n=1 Tax=Cordyceps javanica TaxID=43265 RepID=A0A545UZE5_9HYPO|nr:hypothetical protein IF1G_06856 [Cordyceps javanica]
MLWRASRWSCPGVPGMPLLLLYHDNYQRFTFFSFPQCFNPPCPQSRADVLIPTRLLYTSPCACTDSCRETGPGRREPVCARPSTRLIGQSIE